MDTLIPLVLLEKAYIDRGHLEISMYRLLYVRDILNLFDSYDLITTTYGKRSTKSSMIDYFFYEDETNVKNITRETVSHRRNLSIIDNLSNRYMYNYFAF